MTVLPWSNMTMDTKADQSNDFIIAVSNMWTDPSEEEKRFNLTVDFVNVDN